MATYTYGPGATIQQNQIANNALAQPYMGFGSGSSNIYNWIQDPSANPQSQYIQSIQQRAAQEQAQRQAIAQQQAQQYLTQGQRQQQAMQLAQQHASGGQTSASNPFGFDLSGLAAMFPDLFGGMAQPASNKPAAKITKNIVNIQRQAVPVTRRDQGYQPPTTDPGNGAGGTIPMPTTPAYGGSGGGMQPPSLNVTTGIGVNPVIANPTANANALRNQVAAMPGVPGSSFGPPSSTAVSEQFGDAMRGYSNQNATDYLRQAAYANSQQQLAQQQARAGAGVGWGNLLLGDYSQQLARQAGNQNSLLGILGSLVA